MQINDVKQGSQEWFKARQSKVTGTKLGKLVTRPRGGVWQADRTDQRKVEFYQIVAERLGVTEIEGAEDENPMARGTRLEAVARELYAQNMGVTVTEAGLCVSDKNSSIAYSSDGLLADKSGKYVKDIEIKCLSAARHLKAHFEQEIPSEFEAQLVQAFIVNPELETRDFVFFNPDVECLQMHVIEVHRKNITEKIEWYHEAETAVLGEITACVKSLKKL